MAGGKARQANSDQRQPGDTERGQDEENDGGNRQCGCEIQRTSSLLTTLRAERDDLLTHLRKLGAEFVGVALVVGDPGESLERTVELRLDDPVDVIHR